MKNNKHELMISGGHTDSSGGVSKSQPWALKKNGNHT